MVRKGAAPGLILVFFPVRFRKHATVSWVRVTALARKIRVCLSPPMQTSNTQRLKSFHMMISFAACFVAGTVIFTVLSWSQSAPPGRTKLDLPVEFSKYKGWAPLLGSPHAVPLDLWLRCMAPTQADWARARQKYGPHTEHYIQVYGNQAATKALGPKARRFPTGAVIAKEKVAESPGGDAEGVAFMVKRGAPQFAKTDGWEFVYYPQSGDSRVTHEHCAGCHEAAESTDWVFGHYPR